MVCLRRGGWIEVTMISRGVEISIAGGVEETEDALTIVLFYLYIFIFLFLFLYYFKFCSSS